jgi:hypothetical protein
MRSQIEKNMESLWEDMERHANMAMTEDVVDRLSKCRGAYKALRMMCEEEKAEVYAETVYVDGDTEFEKILKEIPSDRAHMAALASIIGAHLESLAVMNRRTYDNVMAKLREVAR